MADPEKIRNYPPLEVERFPFAVYVDTFSPIPQRDLIIVHLNSALLTRFDLDGVSFSAEGGVRGQSHGIPFELSNWGNDDGKGIGLMDDYYVWGSYTEEPFHFKDVFDFYEVLLKRIFEGEMGYDVLSSKYSIPEQTLAIVNKVLSEVGGKNLPQEVKERILAIPEKQRAYLRGLTDEEIERIFVPPPMTRIWPPEDF